MHIRHPQHTSLPSAHGGTCDGGGDPVVLDLTGLEVGQIVNIDSGDRAQGTATVDAVMADASAVWLQMHNGQGRIMFLTGDRAHIALVTA